jgi:hypothetical protein
MRDTEIPEPLRISAIYYRPNDEYQSRMIDHKWKEFLVFPLIQKEPIGQKEPIRGRYRVLNGVLRYTDSQVTLLIEGCGIMRQ